MIPTLQRGRRLAAFLPGALVAGAAALLTGCVAAPYYDAYGNPVSPAVVAPVAAYPVYDPYPYYGPVVYPAPVYGSVWIGSGGCWNCRRGWGGRGWGGHGWGHGNWGHGGWHHR
ncbi:MULTISPECIES: hypothetical protein [Ralstonia]|uniref:hypothetical protein n=1 Tax=Ralstonia TaxID=48736 RepID=UPI0005D7E57C|nr:MULTISPECIES: hypothetical protein [Ralstonia]AJW46377.1 hypothetical protein TK49_15815 [Ralstonia mannitolilytica]QIF08251.1 hypothetical protein G5A69_11710 [Ralstonia mannitolilytica]CAJ0726158.1 hypothetical protein R76706_00923 [Ralstonia mannitolilytica]CAJ0776624.1 hypothetical protein R77555_00215 [Ralstonia mannitolilytica]